MRALVTGGFGFVGRWFVHSLLAGGWEVHAVDNLYPGAGGIHPSKGWIHSLRPHSKRFTYDIMDVREYFAGATPPYDLVVHLAAIVGGRLVIERNPLAVAEDLSIDASFWKWVGESRPRQIVHFSSSAAYPIALQTRELHRALREDDIDFSAQIGVPDLTYGWSKLTSEFIARYLPNREELDIYTFRPFSGYGEDQDPSYPFPAIVDRALAHETGDFVVWGSGLQVRDFIHISDVVAIVLKALAARPVALALNLGSGEPTSFRELAMKILQGANKESCVKGQDSMPEGVFYRVADISLQSAHTFLPHVSLSEGIGRALEYRKRTAS